MVSESGLLDNSRCGRPQGLPTFCPLQACPGYGWFKQCESPPLICLAISQCVFWMSADSIPQTGSHCIPSSAQCSSPRWNCPLVHPTWILLQIQEERQQPFRWMVLSWFSHEHWSDWLCTTKQKTSIKFDAMEKQLACNDHAKRKMKDIAIWKQMSAYSDESDM